MFPWGTGRRDRERGAIWSDTETSDDSDRWAEIVRANERKKRRQKEREGWGNRGGERWN